MATGVVRPWADEEYLRVYSGLYDDVWPVYAMFQDVLEASEITTTTSVLDVGGGTGFLLRALKDSRLSPFVVELDSDELMLKQARAVAYGSAVFRQADLNESADTWGLGEMRFDRFVAVNCLYIVPDPARTLRELARLAAPGAVLVVSTPRPNAKLTAVLNEHLNYAKRVLNRDPRTERERLLKKYAPIVEHTQRELLSRADFHYPTWPELRTWFAPDWSIRRWPVRRTYAGQNWLVVAERK